MIAAYNNHPECIPHLMKEIKMQDKDGWTALMIAAQKGLGSKVTKQPF